MQEKKDENSACILQDDWTYLLILFEEINILKSSHT